MDSFTDGSMGSLMKSLTWILLSFCLQAGSALADEPQQKIGVFFGSYGDVSAPGEIEELFTTTLQDVDMVPLSRVTRFVIAKAGWLAGKSTITREYERIGYTKYRAISQEQADLVALKLRQMGLWAKGYTGFAFTFPHVDKGIAKAQHDGVNRLVVYYQGAQHSRVTSHIVFREVKNYLRLHPEWNVRVTAVTSFSDDPRFIDLLAASIQRRMDRSFAGVNPSDICIFLPLHGNYIKWLDMGDPSYRQMIYDVDAIKKRFAQSHVYYGFQNHEEIPLLTWTQPRDSDIVKQVAKDPCQHVIINGRTTFTIDNLETMYDEGVEQKEGIEELSQRAGQGKEVVVERMFNVEDGFANYLRDLTLDAMAGRGHTLDISKEPQIFPPSFVHPHE